MDASTFTFHVTGEELAPWLSVTMTAIALEPAPVGVNVNELEFVPTGTPPTVQEYVIVSPASASAPIMVNVLESPAVMLIVPALDGFGFDRTGGLFVGTTIDAFTFHVTGAELAPWLSVTVTATAAVPAWLGVYV